MVNLIFSKNELLHITESENNSVFGSFELFNKATFTEREKDIKKRHIFVKEKTLQK